MEGHGQSGNWVLWYITIYESIYIAISHSPHFGYFMEYSFRCGILVFYNLTILTNNVDPDQNAGLFYGIQLAMWDIGIIQLDYSYKQCRPRSGLY